MAAQLTAEQGGILEAGFAGTLLTRYHGPLLRRFRYHFRSDDSAAPTSSVDPSAGDAADGASSEGGSWDRVRARQVQRASGREAEVGDGGSWLAALVSVQPDLLSLERLGEVLWGFLNACIGGTATSGFEAAGELNGSDVWR